MWSSRFFKSLFSVLVACAFVMPSTGAQAQFPDDNVTYSVTFAPGGLSDRTTRIQQPALEKILGQSVIVQYKPGGGGAIGWAELSRKKKDGYFFATINVPHIILQPMLHGNVGYKTEDLLPVAIFQDTPVGLSVLKNSQFKSFQEIVEYAKANPNKLTVAGSGMFSGDHITHMMVEEKFGIKMRYIPYATGMESLNGFLGGHTMAGWQSSSTVLMNDSANFLAVAYPERIKIFPNTPTFEELGHPIYFSIARGVAVPAGTPADVVKTLEDAFREVCSDPEYKELFEREGYINIFLGSDESVEYLKEQTKMLESLNLKKR